MGKSLTKFAVVIILIALAATLLLNGLTLFSGFKMPSIYDTENGIRLGLDLTGGSVIAFQADVENPTDEQMKTVVNMIRQRLDALGYTEATISRQGSDKVRIEIPSVSDPEEAVAKLGATAQLKFVDSDGKVILTGDQVVKASAQYGQVSEYGGNQHFISLEFSDEGTLAFSDATARIMNLTDGKNYIAIMLDEEVISQPSVSVHITDNNCIITGDFDSDYTKYTADLINAGKLPFDLKNVELQSVGPTLGEKALKTSLIAALIGVILVMLYMLVIYRLPSLVADIALCAYIVIVGLILVNAHINLSLPGIAGIILSIGMAVDANVIIFERMKEELIIGKTLKASINAGFHRAFSAIIDSNITTAIAGIVLFYFGTGPIKGFATTLLIGIVVSMFTAIVVTKFLLEQLVGFNVKNTKLYGAKIKEGK